ncbi:hypothetical protein [Brevibacillus laterosporus]|uniref:hypothetical protein n=1 Tax=Brevibacillus laterosporus TaxID=1465 RepID=UPI00264F42A5|nr:hypothetical protein [Brevibacillus laterosporus]MDN9010027.1 hypothetical protein [Brevibacillus laterosporus]MDO0940591.1 hypothetical protein [Brevibacillus laterosporus]
MLNNKIENVVLAAKSGCLRSREMIYKDFVPIINDYVYKNWFKVQNEATLTKRLLDRLDESIDSYQQEKGSFSQLARINLERAFRQFIKNRKFTREKLTSMNEYIDEDRNTLSEVLPDILADIESTVIDRESIKEKIALLAKGDLRKQAILLAWSDGFYNDSSLSELLAQLFGGKPESHRRAITRFRAFCQAALSQTA